MTKVVPRLKEPSEEQSQPAAAGDKTAERLLHWLIESEINAALIFVAIARNAYRDARFSEGNAALSKVEAIYAQASTLARDSAPETKQAIADLLRELRLAIDQLMLGGPGD